MHHKTGYKLQLRMTEDNEAIPVNAWMPQNARNDSLRHILLGRVFQKQGATTEKAMLLHAWHCLCSTAIPHKVVSLMTSSTFGLLFQGYCVQSTNNPTSGPIPMFVGKSISKPRCNETSHQQINAPQEPAEAFLEFQPKGCLISS